MTEITPAALGGARLAKPAAAAPTLRVLIIDSEPQSRSLLKGALRGFPFIKQVQERGQPHAIAEYLVENPVNIIFVDEALEGGDAFELVRTIKADPATARVKFVLMSSNLNMESRRKGIEVGILGFLSKPFDIQSLDRAIRDAMGKVSTNHKETLDKVRKISFFSGFTDAELVRLLKICHTRKYQSGEAVFRQGDRGDRLYVLLSGEVDIIKRLNDELRPLATMKAGDVFGEMAIVDSEPRSADAIAKSDAMMMELHDQIINDPNDQLALKLFRKFAILVTKKLRDFTRSVADAQKNN